MSKIVGIDLGTTNSLVAIMKDGKPEVIPGPNGKGIVPSVIAFDEGKVVVGDPARTRWVQKAGHTVFSVKRFMGMKYADVRAEAERMPYKVLQAENGDAHIQIKDKNEFNPSGTNSAWVDAGGNVEGRRVVLEPVGQLPDPAVELDNADRDVGLVFELLNNPSGSVLQRE